MAEQSSHSQPEQRNRVPGPLGRLGLARRFDVVAMPGRRALRGRMRILRQILIVLGVITIGIVAYAQWLAWGPDVSAQATLAAYSQSRYEDAFATSTLAPSEPPPTVTVLPSETPTLKPTNTLVPLPTGRPARKATATELASSPTPAPAPALLSPEEGVTALDRMVFEWAWDGPALTENQFFDLRIWSAQEEQQGSPRRGVVPPTKATSVEVSLAAVPAVVDYGPGDYYWTVVLVEYRADGSLVVVGTWGESRRLVYR